MVLHEEVRSGREVHEGGGEHVLDSGTVRVAGGFPLKWKFSEKLN